MSRVLWLRPYLSAVHKYYEYMCTSVHTLYLQSMYTNSGQFSSLEEFISLLCVLDNKQKIFDRFGVALKDMLYYFPLYRHSVVCWMAFEIQISGEIFGSKASIGLEVWIQFNWIIETQNRYKYFMWVHFWLIKCALLDH